MLDRIDRLRERPKDERAALAGGIAIAVVAVLLVGWVAFFLHGLGGGGPVQTAPPVSSPTQGQSTIAPPATTLEWQTSTSSADETASSTVSP